MIYFLLSSFEEFFKHNNKTDPINFEQFNNTNIQTFCFIDIQILRQFNNYKILKILEDKFEQLYNLNETIQICYSMMYQIFIQKNMK